MHKNRGLSWSWINAIWPGLWAMSLTFLRTTAFLHKNSASAIRSAGKQVNSTRFSPPLLQLDARILPSPVFPHRRKWPPVHGRVPSAEFFGFSVSVLQVSLSLSLSLSLGNTGGNPIMKRLNSSSQWGCLNMQLLRFQISPLWVRERGKKQHFRKGCDHKIGSHFSEEKTYRAIYYTWSNFWIYSTRLWGNS